MRGATRAGSATYLNNGISIHAPHAGSDSKNLRYTSRKKYFNPRSPCGERQFVRCQYGISFCISIHAPHAGSDLVYFTLGKVLTISIHAPHAGSDVQMGLKAKVPSDFNPRSPCGERRSRADLLIADDVISIHAPHAGSDGTRLAWPKIPGISIHAPHAGSDALLYYYLR